MGPKTARDRVLTIDDIINQLTAERKKVITELQEGCLHESFIQSRFLYDWRACIFCGFFEHEQADGGFRVITGDPSLKIDTDLFFKFINLSPLAFAAQLKKIVDTAAQSATKSLEEGK